MRKVIRFLLHPIFIFVLCQIVWLAITLLWVLYFADTIGEISKLNLQGSFSLSNSTAIGVMVAGCILLGVLLAGSVWTFILGQRQSYLFRVQQNFLSSVTHELRSPLASLQLAFETLQRRQLEPEIQQKMFQMAAGDIERLSRLVNQVLISARLDRGLETFAKDKPENLNLSFQIDAAIERTRWLDQNIAERMELSCSKDIFVKAPKSALQLILSNLLENAVKYSPGSSKIRVVVERMGTDSVQIAIADKGFGIPKSELKRVFRLFLRSEMANKKAIPGTGVGLFIVKAVITLLGGRVWAESAGEDQGTTFFVQLPAKDTQ